MTYEELLAHLSDVEWKLANAQDLHSRVLYNQIGALHAVIELHFPIIAEQENLEGYPMACHHCNVLYPCSTIQAIEKELA